MTILHVDTGRTMRGGQHQVKLLLTGLRRENHKCLLMAQRESPLADWSAEVGFPVLPAHPAELWLRSPGFDIVHAHDARAHTWAALACRNPFVVSRRVAFPLKTSLLSKWKYQRAARYLAVSQAVAARLLKAGVPADRVDVVFDAVAPWAEQIAWSAENPVVAPAFAGDRGKLSDLTARACQIAGVELRFGKDLDHDLRQASAFVYLTESEGLGSAALLAMEMGVPVIASRVEGLAEVFEHGRSGLYVRQVGPGARPMQVAEEVAGYIRRVLAEPGLAARLIATAQQRVRDRFSLAQLVQGTVNSYRQALDG